MDWSDLATLHNIRTYMQKYEKGDLSASNTLYLIESYRALLSSEQSQKTSDLIKDFIKDHIECLKDSKELKILKATALENKENFEKSMKKEEKAKKQQKANEKYEKELRKRIQDEIKYGQSNNKYLNITEDAKLEGIRIEQGDNSYYKIKFAGQDEISIRIWGNLITQCNKMSKSKKEGLGKSFYDELIKNGGSYLFSDPKEDTPKVDINQQILEEYKTALNIKSKNLNKEQKEYFEIYRWLDEEGRVKLKNQIRLRQTREKLNPEISEILKKDMLKLCAQKGEISHVLEKYEFGIPIENIQYQIINNLVAKSDIWNKFSSKHNENTSALVKKSEYDKGIEEKFKTIQREIKTIIDENGSPVKAIEKCVEELRKKTTIPLPQTLVAEIISQGIFNEGVMTSSVSVKKLKRTNELLNELGINIRYEKLAITKVPIPETASEQNIIDRDLFKNNKHYSSSHKESKEKIEQALGKDNNTIETHHVKPLRCNGFVDEDLNLVSNYVIVAQDKPWNLDMHRLVHLFDTTNGDFLIMDEHNNLSKHPYGTVREIASKTSGTHYILCPILQLKDKDGKYKDVLKSSGRDDECNIYISNKKTSQQWATLPLSLTPPSKTNKRI